jgi:formylglycine-generating enzyme required for sulfatase activity
MVVVPSGSFQMGSTDEDAVRDISAINGQNAGFYRANEARNVVAEHPQHVVTIRRPFALGRYAVTWGEFKVFLAQTRYSADGPCQIYLNHTYESPVGSGWQNPGFNLSDRLPVACVSWKDAQAYLAWLNSKVAKSEANNLGGPYRLPSEAEWEYAERGGTQTARWWGDDVGVAKAVCLGCRSQWDDLQPAPVGSFEPNPFGLYDMLGNLFQWTADCWNQNYVGAPNDGSPWLAGDCTKRVARGGAFMTYPQGMRSASRTKLPENIRLSGFG